MNRAREVIAAQEEVIAAQNVLIEWLLSQVHQKRRTDVGHDREMRNGEMRMVPNGWRRRAGHV